MLQSHKETTIVLGCKNRGSSPQKEKGKWNNEFNLPRVWLFFFFFIYLFYFCRDSLPFNTPPAQHAHTNTHTHAGIRFSSKKIKKGEQIIVYIGLIMDFIGLFIYGKKQVFHCIEDSIYKEGRFLVLLALFKSLFLFFILIIF